MQFAYEGFTHDGSRRLFLFRSVDEGAAASVFSIAIDLPLFLQNRVSVQEGPSFCLQMLIKAFTAGPIQLQKLRSYEVVGDDFRPLVAERERRESEKALKARARVPSRKPPLTSNFIMGAPKSL